MHRALTKTLTLLGSLALAACAVEADDTAGDDVDVAETDQAVGLPPPTTPLLGDIDSDGTPGTGADAASYLTAMGIEVFTYGLVDDHYNLGTDYDRRTTDFQVKTYSDACLVARGLDPRPYPVAKVPGIVDFANTLLKVPQDVVRKMGKDHWQFHIVGEIGHVVQRFRGTVGNTYAEIVFGHDTAPSFSYWGGIHFQIPHTDTWSDMERFSWVSVTGDGHTVSFVRSGAAQVYSGAFDPSGTRLTGKFTWNGGTYDWDVSQYAAGATTDDNFGPGAPHTCAASDNMSVGNTGPAIVYGVYMLPTSGAAHEIGHVIDRFIHADALNYTASDATSFDALFGVDMCPHAAPCTWQDNGYVTDYAAGNPQDDFAETFAMVVYGSVFGRSMATAIAEGGAGVQAKLTYVENRVALPEPGPAAARAPNGQTYRFTTDGIVRYTRGGGVTTIPDANTSRVSVSVASNDLDRLWLVDTSTTGQIRYRSITGVNTFSDWQLTGHIARLPSTVTSVSSTKMAIVMTGDDRNVYYRLFGSTTGALGAVGQIPHMTTASQVAAASLGGRVYVFAIRADNGMLSYAVLDPAMTVMSDWTSLGIAARSVSVARTTRSDGMAELSVVAVDNRFRVQGLSITASGGASGWTVDSTNAVVAPNLAITSAKDLYVRGFDGRYYTKKLGSTSAFVAAGF